MSPTNFTRHKYTPDEIDEDVFVSRFVVRTEEYSELYESICSADYEQPQQHSIIVGQRGQGKTTLLRRLMIAVKKNDLLLQFLIPVKFTEEQYQIRSLCRLWEEVADYLQNLYPEEFGDILDNMEQKFDDDDYEILCFSYLEKYVKSKNKKLLLLIDNIDELLSKLKEKEQRQLREILISSSTFRIIGGSTKMLEQHYDYGKPFYEFFQIIHLRGLDKEECIRFLRGIGSEQQKTKINHIISDSPGRIEILRRITGGVPRTMVMLFDIFIDQTGNAFDDLLQVLDDATPLYKHRMDDLPTTLQDITHVIAMNWDGLGTKEIAAKTRLQSKEVSAQLKQLEKKYGIIESVSTGKNKIYKIEERFFNIWYLMRFGRKKDRQKVEWLVRFLNSWCSPNELEQQAQQFLVAVKHSKVQPSYAYHMCEALGYAGVKAKTEYLMKENVRAFLREQGSDLANIVSSSQNELLGQVQELCVQESFDEAINLLDATTTTDTTTFTAVRAQLYHKVNNHKQAETYYLKAIDAGSTDVLFNLGHLYAEQKDYKQAETFYLKAIDAGFTNALLNLGNLYAEQKDYKQAETFYLKAIDAGSTNALSNLGSLYAEQKDYKQAETCYLKAIDAGFTNALSNLGLLYAEQNDYKQAETYYLKAIDAGSTNALSNLGLLYAEQKDCKQAETYYIKAIDVGSTEALFNLGFLYDEQKDYKQAETYYLKAVDVGSTNALFNLGSLYAKQKDYEQAETYYLKSLDLGDTNVLFNLGLLYDKQKDYKQAETYYLKATDAGSTNALLNLGLLYDEQKDYKQAEAYYLKAIDAGSTDAHNSLSWCYFEQSKESEAATRHANISCDIEKTYENTHTLAVVLLWAEEFTSSSDVFKEWLQFDAPNNMDNYLTTYLLLLLAKGQYYQAKKLFELEQYQLKDRLKPVWYALMSLMQDEFPHEIKKMGSELKVTVDEVLISIANMSQKYNISE